MSALNTTIEAGPQNPADQDEVVFPSLLDPRRLTWLIRLRWVFIAAFMAVLVIERWLRPELERPRQIEIVLLLLMFANSLWWVLHRRLGRVPNDSSAALERNVLAQAHGQIAVDLLMLTLLVRFTGGVESLLAVFYVFHMALGSLLLPSGHALAEGLWAILLYAVVGLGELFGAITPHYPLVAGVAPGSYGEPSYVTLALAAMACGVLGTLYLTGTIAALLRRRQNQLLSTNAALRQSQRAIRDLQARRSLFMQTAAHRLKSPLATIRTLASLVCDEVVKGADACSTCRRITRCCDEGIEHVGELLTLARVQDVAPQQHRRSVAKVGDVVREQCARYHSIATNRGIEMTTSVPTGVDLHANVDTRDLGDCVANLVDNALKYTPTGGSVDIRVERVHELGGDGEHDWIVIHVDDTGMGFDASALVPANGNEDAETSVFDAYRRGNNALAAGIPGSGLGLAIVHVVTEQAGGRIHLRSAPGLGTQFTLRFPAIHSAAAANGALPTLGPHIAAGRAHGPQAAFAEIELVGPPTRRLSQLEVEVDHAHT